MSKQLDSNWLTLRTQLDGFGTPVLSSSAEDGKKFNNSPSYTIHSSTIYDGLGRPVSNPYRSTSASTNGWTRTTYDQLGRVTEVASFGANATNDPPPPTGTGGSTGYSGSVLTTYSSEQTTVTDQANKQRRSTIDGLGRLIKIEEMNESPATTVYATTTYDYDARGNLRQVNQTNNSVAQTRRFAYDNLSRLIFAANPEQETSTDATFTYISQNWAVKYVYDVASNLTDKLDTRQVSGVFVKVHYDYDALNRVTQRTYTDGTPATPQVNYVYDTATKGVGRLASVEAVGVSKYNYLVYDSLGRVTSSRQDTASQNYSMGYAYNKAGLMTDETYPSTKVIHTDYDVAGRIAGVKKTGSMSYYAGAGSSDTNRMHYTAQGAVDTMLLGNTLWEHTNFNSRLQPEQIGLGTLSTNSSVLQLDYTYGVSATTNNGNIKSQTITAPNVGGGTAVSMVQSYTYDQVNRLKTFAEADGWSQTYDYDQAGNRWVSAGDIPTLSQTPRTQSSFVAGTNRMNPSVMLGFGYDKAGNLMSMANAGSGTDSMAYDAESRQKSYTKSGQPANNYFYDGDGRRVKRIDTGNNATTVFVYNVAGQLIAEYQTDPMAPLSGGGGTSYLTSDHLGSTRVVTNSSGVKARYDYLPFGEEMGAGVGQRSTAMGYNLGDSTRQKFTQKERDNESGLDYFGARYYSSPQGRFTSVDPHNIILEAQATAEVSPQKAKAQFLSYLAAPQQWNRYSYVANNPLVYIDPTGEILELTGSEEERKWAFERIKALVGSKAAGSLYIREENGHYFVETNNATALDASGKLGVVVNDVIASSTVVQFRVSSSTTTQDAAGRSVDLAENGGGYTGRFVRNGKSFIQIIVDVNADSLATSGARRNGAVADDGKPLRYFNDVADAHEFGHAYFYVKNLSRFENAVGWWQFWKRGYTIGELKEQSNRTSVDVENWARERRGLNKRTEH